MQELKCFSGFLYQSIKSLVGGEDYDTLSVKENTCRNVLELTSSSNVQCTVNYVVKLCCCTLKTSRLQNFLEACILYKRIVQLWSFRVNVQKKQISCSYFCQLVELVCWCSLKSIKPLMPKCHYSGFVIKFIIKIITRVCLVL